jgi:trehalose 6-phosphate synthase
MASACDAVWVCYGDGDADFEVTDAAGHVRVPPSNPRYTLKRIPLSQEEIEATTKFRQ